MSAHSKYHFTEILFIKKNVKSVLKLSDSSGMS